MQSTHPGHRPSSPPHCHLERSEPGGRTTHGSACGSSAASSPEPPGAPLGGGASGGAAWSALLPGAEAMGAAGSAVAQPSSSPAPSSAAGGRRAPPPPPSLSAGAAVRVGAGASSASWSCSVAAGLMAAVRSGRGSLGSLISKRAFSLSLTMSGTRPPSQPFLGTSPPSPSTSTTSWLVPWRPWVKLVRQSVAATIAPVRVCAMISARATSSADSSAAGGLSVGRGSPRKCRPDGLGLAGLGGGSLPPAAATLAASRFAASDDFVRTMPPLGSHGLRGSAKEKPTEGGKGEKSGARRRSAAAAAQHAKRRDK